VILASLTSRAAAVAGALLVGGLTIPRPKLAPHQAENTLVGSVSIDMPELI
jgi:hypothetical protein